MTRISLLLLLTPVTILYGQTLDSQRASTDSHSQQAGNKEEDGTQLERAKWFYGQREYPGTTIPAGARVEAIRRLRLNDAAARQQRRAAPVSSRLRLNGGVEAALDSAHWTSIGPQPT